jgi:hypothetical protein
MNNELNFDVEWIDGKQDVMAARIRIDVAGNNACLVINGLISSKVEQSAPLSAGPLALWLANYWWRLRWEGEPTAGRNSFWKEAHEMTSAGEGFLWPRLTFISNGDTIRVECIQTEPHSKDRLFYRSAFQTTISAAGFETGVDNFLALVIQRAGTSHTYDLLRSIWKAVLEERADPELARYRRMEAILDYNPDTAPKDLVERYIESIDIQPMAIQPITTRPNEF